LAINQLVGGFNPSEKYKSQLGRLFPIYGKIKNVPNHQPAKDDDVEVFMHEWLVVMMTTHFLTIMRLAD